jgi:tetratricopeptide (TPR) repeat protein
LAVPRQKSDHVDSASALAQRLKSARERAGLSQRQLAAGICTPAYVSRLEKGERIPSLQLLRRLGERIGVDADELASGSPAELDVLLDAELALRLGELDEAEQRFTEALKIGPHKRAPALIGLGQVAFARGDHREAIVRLEEASSLRGGLEAAALDSLGRAYAMVGALDAAAAHFERGLSEARSRDDRIEALRFTVLLGNALVDAGDFERARALLDEALESAEATRDPLLRARVWWSQSGLFVAQNDAAAAAKYARLALETLELSEHTAYAARAFQLMAHIEIDTGRAEHALELIDRGLPLIEQTGNKYDIAMFRLEKARGLAALGRREEAAGIALDASGRLSDASPTDAGRAYGLVAEILAGLGERARAVELFELALETLPAADRYRAETAEKLADILEAEGRTEDALSVLRDAVRSHRRA